MKLLLTSAGIRNTSIQDALVELLDKPIAECDALCIPTATYGHPQAGPGRAWNFIAGAEPRTPMCELGSKSLGVLELTALPSLDEKLWVPWIQESDVQMTVPAYAIDDETAIKVVDSVVEVVSEGHWKLFD